MEFPLASSVSWLATDRKMATVSDACGSIRRPRQGSAYLFIENMQIRSGRICVICGRAQGAVAAKRASAPINRNMLISPLHIEICIIVLLLLLFNYSEKGEGGCHRISLTAIQSLTVKFYMQIWPSIDWLSMMMDAWNNEPLRPFFWGPVKSAQLMLHWNVWRHRQHRMQIDVNPSSFLFLGISFHLTCGFTDGSFLRRITAVLMLIDWLRRWSDAHLIGAVAATVATPPPPPPRIQVGEKFARFSGAMTSGKHAAGRRPRYHPVSFSDFHWLGFCLVIFLSMESPQKNFPFSFKWTWLSQCRWVGSNGLTS